MADSVEAKRNLGKSMRMVRTWSGWKPKSSRRNCVKLRRVRADPMSKTTARAISPITRSWRRRFGLADEPGLEASGLMALLRLSRVLIKAGASAESRTAKSEAATVNQATEVSI